MLAGNQASSIDDWSTEEAVHMCMGHSRAHVPQSLCCTGRLVGHLAPVMHVWLSCSVSVCVHGALLYQVGFQRLVRSVPGELNSDKNKVLRLAQGSGHISKQQLAAVKPPSEMMITDTTSLHLFCTSESTFIARSKIISISCTSSAQRGLLFWGPHVVSSASNGERVCHPACFPCHCSLSWRPSLRRVSCPRGGCGQAV